MTTEKALEIIDEVLDDYDAKNRRDVLIVLRRARELLEESGMPRNGVTPKVGKHRRNST
jgi:hypothetical protein